MVPVLSRGRTGATDVPAIIDDAILPPLTKWARGAAGRNERLRLCFGYGATASGEANWDEEKVLERYELLYEAGLIEEAQRDGRVAQVPAPSSANRCASITGAFWPPQSRGCAAS